MNIPTIEELAKIGHEAAIGVANPDSQRRQQAFASAIRDTVVAACRPQLRPIAEMPMQVPDGCVRIFFASDGKGVGYRQGFDTTHFIDIALPVEAYPADFEQAFKESGLDSEDKDAAFKLWKGGAR